MISVQISVDDQALRSLYATMEDLAEGGQEFLRPHARDLLEAAQGEILEGGHVVTGRLLLSGRMEQADDGFEGWDVVFGANDPIAGHATASEEYASYHEYGTDDFEGHPVITSEAPAIERQIVRAIERKLE